MGKNLGLLTQLWLRLRAGEGRKQARSPRMKAAGEERGKDGWACSLARSRSFALAGNLSAGKNVPKALEHVEPPLALACALTLALAVDRQRRDRFSEGLSHMTEDGKLC